MKKDNLKILFKKLENDFDLETPSSDHKQRFLDKLNNQTKTEIINTKSKIWRPLISVAASIVLLISLFVGFQQDSDSKDLASISPEMANTQNFFTNVITTELEKLNSKKTPEYQSLIDDALIQIKILEENYEQLKLDLTKSGDDKRVIYAMISNFQNRIDVLQNVLQNIEDIKQFKNNIYENSSTI